VLLILGQVEENLDDHGAIAVEVRLQVPDGFEPIVPEGFFAPMGTGETFPLEEIGVHPDDEDFLIVGTVENADVAPLRKAAGRPPQEIVLQLFKAGLLEAGVIPELDENLSHITVEVQRHLESLEAEILRNREGKAVILNSLDSMARMGLEWLNRLGAIAKFPEDGFGVQALKGKPYLRIVSHAVEEAQRKDVLAEVLQEYLKIANTTDGLRLAQMVVQRVAMVKSVRMRHPDPNRTTSHADGMEDLRAIQNNSGGERLAQVLMLYAALTKLRGGRGAESGGGVLFMDNPFGALTKNVFMEQVRAVASNHKIQLIFTCGVQDAPSISDYDHFVALRKRPMTGANGDYERVEVVHAGRMEDLRNG